MFMNVPRVLMCRRKVIAWKIVLVQLLFLGPYLGSVYYYHILLVSSEHIASLLIGDLLFSSLMVLAITESNRAIWTRGVDRLERLKRERDESWQSFKMERMKRRSG